MIICPNPTSYIAGTILEKARFAKIFHRMTAMEGKSPMEALIKLQTAKGIDQQTAEANARQCIIAVAGRETLFEQVTEDTVPMDRLFVMLAEKDADERLQLLHRIYFGLTIQSDPAYTGKGSDIEQMFRSYYATAANAHTAEEMEDRIRQALQSYHVSPTAMKMMAHELKKSKGCLATAAAIGESGRNLKCLMTMELWLQNQESMTMDEAANTACASADYQAVADAVNKGYITRKVAMKILKVIGIAMLVFGAFLLGFGAFSHWFAGAFVSYVEANAAVIAADASLVEMVAQSLPMVASIQDAAPVISALGAERLVFGGVVTFLSTYAANLIGSLSAWIAGLFQPAEDAAPAMDALNAEVEAEAAAEATQEAPAAEAPQAAPVQDAASTLTDSDIFEDAEEEDEDEDLLMGF